MPNPDISGEFGLEEDIGGRSLAQPRHQDRQPREKLPTVESSKRHLIAALQKFAIRNN